MNRVTPLLATMLLLLGTGAGYSQRAVTPTHQLLIEAVRTGFAAQLQVQAAFFDAVAQFKHPFSVQGKYGIPEHDGAHPVDRAELLQLVQNRTDFPDPIGFLDRDVWTIVAEIRTASASLDERGRPALENGTLREPFVVVDAPVRKWQSVEIVNA